MAATAEDAAEAPLDLDALDPYMTFKPLHGRSPEDGQTTEEPETDDDEDEQEETEIDEGEAEEAEPDEAEEEQEDDAAEPEAEQTFDLSAFNPADPKTWPESDIPKVRAAQALITQREQLLAQKADRVTRFETAASRFGTEPDGLLQILENASQGIAPTLPGAPQQGFGGPQAQPQPVQPAQGFESDLDSEILEAQSIYETAVEAYTAESVEARQAASNYRTLSRLKQAEVRDQQRAAQREADEQSRTRTQTQTNELSRLKSDARFRTYLADPEAEIAITSLLRANPSLSVEHAVWASIGNRMLTDTGQEAVSKESKALATGKKLGSSVQAKRNGASLQKGRSTTPVKATETPPKHVARDPHRLLAWVRSRDSGM